MIGSICSYRLRPEEDARPAIIMQQWPDGSYQLWVIQFESFEHIRSAHPSQIEVLISAARLQSLEQRIEDLESVVTSRLRANHLVSDLIADANETDNDLSDIEMSFDKTGKALEQLIGVDSTSDESTAAEPEMVLVRKGKSRAWPPSK